jgi:hypothetical protein
VRAVAALALAACAGGAPAGGGGGPAPDDTGSLPLVTWESFGEALMVEHCQPCHASTTPDRYGAPEDVIFDTEAAVLARRDAVLAAATGAAPSMPPALPLDETDQARLRAWLRPNE